jgi:hypothetical protein
LVKKKIIPAGGEFFRTRHFPGNKRPGRGVENAPSSSAEAEEGIELSSTFLYLPIIYV